MQVFIPFLVIHVICSILVKAIIWREGYSNIGPIYELAMKIMQLWNSAGHAISIDNFSTLYHIGNVNQRKLIESFLIKNIPNMNLYKTSITIDNFTSSIIYNNVPNLKKLVDQSIDNG